MNLKKFYQSFWIKGSVRSENNYSLLLKTLHNDTVL